MVSRIIIANTNSWLREDLHTCRAHLLGRHELLFQHLSVIDEWIPSVLADLRRIYVITSSKCDSVSDVSAVRALTGFNSASVTGGQVQYHERAILPKRTLNLMQMFSQPFSAHMLNIKETLSHFTPLCTTLADVPLIISTPTFFLTVAFSRSAWNHD